MGIYDRDYFRQQRPQPRLRGPRTIVGMLILINVVLFLANGLFTPPVTLEQLERAFDVDGASFSWEELFHKRMGSITYHMALKGSTLGKPLRWWQFLTYGFAHAPPPEYWHIGANMLVLFFLGRDIERRYGPREFLRLYLVMLVVAGVVWVGIERMRGANPAIPAVGASGAIAGIVVLYALNFPHRTLLLFFVIPMPAWVAGLLIVLMDIYGALTGAGHIAFTAHLGGAAFAFLYYQFGWNLTRWTAWLSLDRMKPRRNLRVHDPDRKQREKQELSDEVDRILQKISQQGEQSLTRQERRTLETASRQYQRRRSDPGDDGP